jgi:hypothetical protein
VDGHDAHRTRNILPEQDDVLARVFIGSDHGMKDPISPKDVLSVNSHIKWMLWRHFGQNETILAVQVGSFDFVNASIGPVEFLGKKVQSETVRHADVSGDDRLNIKTVDIGSLDGRVLDMPIGPIDTTTNNKS